MHLCVTAMAETFDPTGYKGSAIPNFISTPTGRPVEPPFHQMVCRCPYFDDSPLPAVDPNDEEEEEDDFPTTPLDNSVWSEEPMPERDLCIHMAPRKPETSYPSQIPIKPQEPIYESATLEEPMDSMISDIPNLTDIPKEVFFQNYLYILWM